MKKYEIENKIFEEIKNFFPSVEHIPFDKALPLLRQEAWRLADKYDTDGANVMNILISRFGEIKDEN